MKVIKALILAAVAAAAFQFSWVSTADAHDANKRARAKCDQRCEERYYNCRDWEESTGKKKSPSCLNRESRCKAYCLNEYEYDYDHSHGD